MLFSFLEWRWATGAFSLAAFSRGGAAFLCASNCGTCARASGHLRENAHEQLAGVIAVRFASCAARDGPRGARRGGSLRRRIELRKRGTLGALVSRSGRASRDRFSCPQIGCLVCRIQMIPARAVGSNGARGDAFTSHPSKTKMCCASSKTARDPVGRSTRLVPCVLQSRARSPYLGRCKWVFSSTSRGAGPLLWTKSFEGVPFA